MFVVALRSLLLLYCYNSLLLYVCALCALSLSLTKRVYSVLFLDSFVSFVKGWEEVVDDVDDDADEDESKFGEINLQPPL